MNGYTLLMMILDVGNALEDLCLHKHSGVHKVINSDNKVTYRIHSEDMFPRWIRCKLTSKQTAQLVKDGFQKDAHRYELQYDAYSLWFTFIMKG